MKKWYFNEIEKFAQKNLVPIEIINIYFQELESTNSKLEKDNIKLKIISCCDKLIRWCIYNYFTDDVYMEEDLYMCSIEAILKAINKYDYKKYDSFYLYCAPAIIYNLKRAFPSLYNIEWKNMKNPITDNYLIMDFDSIIDDSNKPDEVALDLISREEKIKYLFELLSKLDVEERYIIIQRYGLCGSKSKTLKELGKEFSMTKQGMQSYIDRIIKKLIFFHNLNTNPIIENKIIKNNYSDDLFNKLEYLLECNISENTILTFMRLEGYDWTYNDLNMYILLLYKIRCFISDNVYCESDYISFMIREEFKLCLSNSFIDKTKSLFLDNKKR